MQVEDLADVYMEIADKIGVEAAVAIHEMFRGQQILFPQKLYSSSFRQEALQQNHI